MGKVIAGMTMSVDGFVNDPSGSVEALYPDLEAVVQTKVMQESIQNTGAVVMGRHAYAMAEDPDWFAGNYEYQVPIFVLTHEAPKRRPKEAGGLTFTFVTDGIESAVRQAKAAAGEKDVTVIGGASTLQQVIREGLADELHVDIMPVLLGGGLRMFEATGAGPVRLEKIRMDDGPGGRAQLSFRVVK